MRAGFEILWISVVVFFGTAGILFGGEAQDAFEAGVKFYRAGKFRDAIAAYDRTIKAAPKAAEAYLGRGSAYAKVGQADRAIKDYDEAIRLNPDLADAYYKRGDAHDESKQYQAASKDYDAALRRNPTRTEVY